MDAGEESGGEHESRRRHHQAAPQVDMPGHFGPNITRDLDLLLQAHKLHAKKEDSRSPANDLLTVRVKAASWV